MRALRFHVRGFVFAPFPRPFPSADAPTEEAACSFPSRFRCRFHAHSLVSRFIAIGGKRETKAVFAVPHV